MDKILCFDSCNQTWHGSKQQCKLSQKNWPYESAQKTQFYIPILKWLILIFQACPNYEISLLVSFTKCTFSKKYCQTVATKHLQISEINSFFLYIFCIGRSLTKSILKRPPCLWLDKNYTGNSIIKRIS